MESMVKYVLFMIVLALAIASTAQGKALYTGSKGEPIRDGLCAEVDVKNKKTATAPDDIWVGEITGCKDAEFTCADSEFCKKGSKVTALIVGGESGSGSKFTLSSDAFNDITENGASEIGLVYTPL